MKLTHENSENKGFFEGKTRERKKEEEFSQSQRTGYMTFGKNGPIERSFICVFHTKKLTSVGPTPSAREEKFPIFGVFFLRCWWALFLCFSSTVWGCLLRVSFESGRPPSWFSFFFWKREEWILKMEWGKRWRKQRRSTQLVNPNQTPSLL